MPVLPFLARWRSGRNAKPAIEPVARVRAPDATAWRTLSGGVVIETLRQVWPRHASRVAVLLGSQLTLQEMSTVRAVRRALGISAVERADGTCHAPAGSVIAAALKYEVVAGEDLAHADCIVCLGDPTGDDAEIAAHLLTARAVGVPVIAVGVDKLPVATTSIPMRRDQLASFLHAATRALLAEGAIDRSFITGQTVGFGEFLADLESDPAPAVHRDDEDASETLAAFVAVVRNSERMAFVWRPTAATGDARIARAAAGLLLVRGSVGRPGAGLCLTGPIAVPHPSDCCAVRSSGLNTGIGMMARPIGVVERAQLGDIDVLITVGDRPFADVDAALEREALQDIRMLIHVGTQGSDSLPVQGVEVMVLPGRIEERLVDLVRAFDSELGGERMPAELALGSSDREYAFVARRVVEPRRAS